MCYCVYHVTILIYTVFQLSMLLLFEGKTINVFIIMFEIQNDRIFTKVIRKLCSKIHLSVHFVDKKIDKHGYYSFVKCKHYIIKFTFRNSLGGVDWRKIGTFQTLRVFMSAYVFHGVKSGLLNIT